MAFGAPGIPVASVPTQRYPRAAKTYLCYGIPVTNESLTYASMAYQRLDGPFRFIRLVQKRISEDTLQTARGSAVRSLPIELWDVIRYRLTDIELEIAEAVFLQEHKCDYCLVTQDRRYQETTWADMLLCDGCVDAMTEYDAFQHHHMLNMCRKLLGDYGLDMPSTRLLRSHKSRWRHCRQGDPEAVAFIALPSSRVPYSFGPDRISYEEPLVDDGDNYYNDGIWPISFDTPADADQRFRHLVRDFRLSPLEVSDGTIGHTRAVGLRRTRTSQAIDADEVEPQWHLFTTVENAS